MLKWLDYARMPEAALVRHDLVDKNIACAVGLPAKIRLAPDSNAAARRCEEMAVAVRHYTDLRTFHASPEKWDGSAAMFRMHVLCCVLQRHFGVRYNPSKKARDVPFAPEDSFIHGILWGDGGTCASLPVLMAAVGRRLGYPLRLVTAVAENDIGHMFCRWDEPGCERFNIEATAEGLGTPPDDYYRTGLYRIARNDERHGGHLKSLSPREELAVFVAERGHCWLEAKRYADAATCFAWSWGLFPANKAMKNRLINTMNAWGEDLLKLVPRGFPPLKVYGPSRLLPDSVPLEVEKDLVLMHAREAVLRYWEYEALWWAPMRAGRRPHDTPTLIEVRGEPGRFQVNVRLPPCLGPMLAGLERAKQS